MNMTQQVSVNSKDIFRSHGVPERYLEKWFRNYEATTKAQKEALEIIKTNIARKPMLFLGKHGNGKTHLATAVVKNRLIYGQEAQYYTLASLLRSYRCSLGNPEFNEKQFFSKILECDTLVIDEFNVRSDSESENRVIQEIVDSMYSKKSQVILIANMSIKEFTEIIGERLIDRLKEQGAEVINFNWKSHRRAE